MKTEGLSKALEKARDNCTQLADMGVEKEMLEMSSRENKS